MDYSSGRIAGCRIYEFTHNNMTYLSLENDLLKLLIMLDKGADIVEILYKPKDINFLWTKPGGIRDTTHFIPSNACAEGNFLDYYEGGYQDIIPGGGPFNYKGVEMGFHGEACLLPWNFYIEEDSAQKISVVLSCRLNRFPFLIKKRIIMARSQLKVIIQESIDNESSEDIEFMWGQHPAYGLPFLDGECIIDIPAKKFTAIGGGDTIFPYSRFTKDYCGTWPIASDKNSNEIDMSILPSREEETSDLFFLEGLEEGRYTITNKDLKLGIGFKWDINIFPYVWYYQVMNSVPGYGRFERTYNIALEFFTSYPNNFEIAKANNRVLEIKGNGRIETEFEFFIINELENSK